MHSCDYTEGRHLWKELGNNKPIPDHPEAFFFWMTFFIHHYSSKPSIARSYVGFVWMNADCAECSYFLKFGTLDLTYWVSYRTWSLPECSPFVRNLSNWCKPRRIAYLPFYAQMFVRHFMLLGKRNNQLFACSLALNQQKFLLNYLISLSLLVYFNCLIPI